MVDSAVRQAEASTEGTYHGFTTLLELLNREVPRLTDVVRASFAGDVKSRKLT